MSVWVACDIETTGLDFNRDTVTSFAYWTNREQGILTDLEKIKAWFVEHKHDGLVWHNGKFDVKVLWKAGIPPDLCQIGWDTLYAESILPDRPVKLDLQSCVAKELGFPAWKSKENYTQGSAESMQTLNLTDVEYTYRLFLTQYEKLHKLGLLEYVLKNNLGIASVKFLAEVENRGIGFNYEAMQALWKENIIQHELLVSRLYERYQPLVVEYEEAQLKKHPLRHPAPGAKAKTLQLYEERLKARQEKYRFNFGSPKQVEWLLTQKLHFPCKNLEGKISTAKDVLVFYQGQHPIFEDLLALRHNEHDAGSFFKNWHAYAVPTDQGHRLHPNYRMDVTRTFRLSCAEPNLQQVPRGSHFRQLFVAKPQHRLAVVDYSMIEPRLIAHYSEDPVLTEIFRTDTDLYWVVAKEVMGYHGDIATFKTKDKALRSIAKEIALSSFYGIGPDKLAYRIKFNTGMTLSAGEAKQYLNGYFNLLSGVRAFKVALVSVLQRNPVLYNFLGRQITFKPAEFTHLAFNKLIQCTGSDINLYSQIDLDNCFKSCHLEARCIHLVHDEAIFEYRPDEEDRVLAAIQYYMADRYNQAPFNLAVPIKIEINTGDSWAVK